MEILIKYKMKFMIIRNLKNIHKDQQSFKFCLMILHIEDIKASMSQFKKINKMIYLLKIGQKDLNRILIKSESF